MFDLKFLASYLPEKVSKALLSLDSGISSRISELRIRKCRPMIAVIKNTSYFIDYNGELYESPNPHTVVFGSEEFEKTFMEICSYSVHSNLEGLKRGFITLENGARVGIAASAVYDGNSIISVKNVTSLNIRIPREMKGFADTVLNFLYVNSFPSVIVAGRTNSGKTTLLRDMARGLSGGFNHSYKKVAVVDERGELAGFGAHMLDMGINTDVLSGYRKAQGIELAVRTLSPEMIICDEISDINEVRSVAFGFASGISFALSVHAATREELKRKTVIKELLSTGEFSYIVLLDGYTYHPEIIEASEVYDEGCGYVLADSFNNLGRSIYY